MRNGNAGTGHSAEDCIHRSYCKEEGGARTTATWILVGQGEAGKAKFRAEIDEEGKRKHRIWRRRLLIGANARSNGGDHGNLDSGGQRGGRGS